MKKTTYQIEWDNGNSASGLFPMVFTSKREATRFGREWKRDMVAVDDDPKTAREDYQWEIIQTELELHRTDHHWDKCWGVFDPRQKRWVYKDTILKHCLDYIGKNNRA